MSADPITPEEQQAYKKALNLIDSCRRGVIDPAHIVTKGSSNALPPTIGVSEDLKKFYFQHTLLSQLPPEIGHLNQVEMLYLQNNKLTRIPPEIGNLKSLKRLFLTGNELSALPQNIGRLTLLTHLFAHDNRIEVLPSQIGKLRFLERLRLEDNELRDLPPEMKKLSRLKGLYLHSNTALNIPENILGPKWDPTSPKTILNHYFASKRIPGPNSSVINISMRDYKPIHVGNVTDSKVQIGQTLKECTIAIQKQAGGKQKELLEELEKQVKQLIDELPEDKKAKAPELAEDLKMLVKQSTAENPRRDWYLLSADGLLKAAKWVARLTIPITGTIEALKKLTPP